MLSPQEGALREAFEEAGIAVEIDDGLRMPASTLDELDRAREALADRLRAARAEVVLASTHRSFLAVDAAHLAGLPSIWSYWGRESGEALHAGVSEAVADRARACHAYPYRLVFGSYPSRSRLSSLCRWHNTAVVEAVIDRPALRRRVEAVSRRGARRGLRLRGRDVAVVLVGRPGESDGQVDLVRALEHLPDLFLRRVRCFIVCGEEGVRDDLEAARRRLPQERGARVSIVPYGPDGRDAVRHYAAADLVVCPSPDEGFSRALQEAMACGLPVVTTPSHGIRERRQRDGHAMVYPPGDVRALAKQLRVLVADAKLRARMGASGRVVLETHTRHHSFVDLWCEMVREAYLTGSEPVEAERRGATAAASPSPLPQDVPLA